MTSVERPQRDQEPTREELLAEYQDNSDFIRHQDRQYWVLWGVVFLMLAAFFRYGTSAQGVDLHLLVAAVLLTLLAFYLLTLRYIHYHAIRTDRVLEIEERLGFNSYRRFPRYRDTWLHRWFREGWISSAYFTTLMVSVWSLAMFGLLIAWWFAQ